MKRLAVLLAVILCASLAATAQEVNKAERDRLLNYLKQTQNNLKKETKGLSETQWNFKAAPDRWSVRDCLEHLALAEDFLRGMINDRVLKSPATPEKYDAAKARQQDDAIIKMISDRSQRVQAPEPLRPAGKWATPQETWKYFENSRKQTLAIAKTTQVLRVHHQDSPVAKDVDAYQWLLFVGAHTARHTKQIQDVKADPHFPKK